MRLPSKELNFRRRYLNQRVSQHASLITSPDWKACEDKSLTFRETHIDASGQVVLGEPIILALDLSMRTDLTALVAVSLENGSRVKAWFWKPEDCLDDHTRRDRIAYSRYARTPREDGIGMLLDANPGRIVNPSFVARRIVNLCSKYDVHALVYDRTRIGDVLRYFEEVGFEAQEGDGWGLRVAPWGQGFVGMSPAIEAFEAAVLNNELKHEGHPLLTSCVMHALSRSDELGNRKLDKKASRFRIDGAVALAMALGFKEQDRPALIPSSPWEDPDFKITAL